MRADYVAPPQTPLELYEMLPEGTRAELINNAIHMPPSPLPDHQETSMDLSVRLYLFLKEQNKGKVYAAPLDVYLGDGANVVQPDLTVVLTQNLPHVFSDKRRFQGVPDLIVEILSEGNKDYDLTAKKDLYERFGVKEYFIVNPETGLTCHYFLQENGRYELAYEHIRKLESRLLAHTFTW